MNSPELETNVAYTYLLPMRLDNPAYVDFNELKAEITDIMGRSCTPMMVGRLVTILGAGQGLANTSEKIEVHHARQLSGQQGGVKAISFLAPGVTVEDVRYAPGAGVGRIEKASAAAVISFANRFQRNQEKPPYPPN